ncbi:suppressor of rasval19 [Vanrija albida]|uniref:Adenylyl cyclase-associated protein n=1 Tax=Vanrija albida TaxID=181172 RepID=A0ABR3PWV5_9TREE
MGYSQSRPVSPDPSPPQSTPHSHSRLVGPGSYPYAYDDAPPPVPSYPPRVPAAYFPGASDPDLTHTLPTPPPFIPAPTPHRARPPSAYSLSSTYNASLPAKPPPPPVPQQPAHLRRLKTDDSSNMAAQPQGQGLHSLSTILKRLEAVTSRLEDVAVSQQSVAATASLRTPTAGVHDSLAPHVAAAGVGAAAGAAAGVASAPRTPSAPAPPPPPPPPPAAVEEELTPAVKAYQDDLVNGLLAEFTANAAKVGGLVQEHSALVPPLLEKQLEFLKFASQYAKPSASAFAPLLKPQADAIGAILEAKDKLGRSKEGRDWGAAFSVLGEGAGAWGWVQVEPAPAPYVLEMKNASQFWVDRVIKQYKETKPEAVEWARSFVALIDGLQKYVKQWHTTGVVWNAKGAPAPKEIPVSGAPATPAATPPASGAPPPPPPPPAAAASNGGGGGGHAALLASLNKGGDITSGLRKVDSSQQTHKNPELRAAGVVSDKKVSSPPPIKAKPASFSKAAPKKPAKTELVDGNKWVVEYHEDNRNIIIDDVALHHTVHIFNCKNTVVQIKGKINAVNVLNCKKTSVVVENLVSGLSITSSPSFEVQVTGLVPTIQIDQTDSGIVYLSQESLPTTEIITSKTSAINISIPTGDDGDFKESPVPEQLKSRVVDGKLVTEIVEHAG